MSTTEILTLGFKNTGALILGVKYTGAMVLGVKCTQILYRGWLGPLNSLPPKLKFCLLRSAEITP